MLLPAGRPNAPWRASCHYSHLSGVFRLVRAQSERERERKRERERESEREKRGKRRARSGKPQSAQLHTRVYSSINVFLLFDSSARGLVTTILPEVLRKGVGTGRVWLALGLMQGIKGFLAFLMAPLIGALSDTWGRKPFLVGWLFVFLSAVEEEGGGRGGE